MSFTEQRLKEAFDEHESKSFLRSFGIPVVHEITAADEKSALEAAESIGYPVVIKGLGKRLLHKSDRALVRLNIPGKDGVRLAVREIAVNAGDLLEGFLVQPHISAKRELVAGLFRDPYFGPVVMFGLGGILTEALSDVVFRIAPVDEAEAEKMIREIRSTKILGAFRGEKEVRTDQLIRILMSLSRIGMEHPEILEIDINPILADSNGNLLAVDALMVKGEKTAGKEVPVPVDPDWLGRFFHPRSIAFIGVSSQIGKWGHMLFTSTVSGGYAGGVHLVNSKGKPIADRKVYPSIEAVPDSVDLCVVTVPANQVLPLIPQLQRKKIRNMLLITSGFSETGKEGTLLEHVMVRQARDAGILIVGPNTMGICNPHIRLYCTGSHVHPDPGATAVVSQSGNMGTQLLAFAERQGIGIRGFCGSGNEAMVTVEDFLEAFEDDPLTQTVMLYVESVKNGRRFLECARRVGKKKPIVLLKGGRSESGQRAAATHTGALAHDRRIFDAACRQAGIVQVKHSMDLLDLSAAFSSLPLPKGNRVAIMTLGGGWGVVTVDLCSDYGLAVPDLTPDIRARIDRLLPDYWSKTNPVDLVGERDVQIPLQVMEALVGWKGCDAVINLGIIGRKILIDRLSCSVLNADPTYTKESVTAIMDYFRRFEEEYIAHIVSLMEQYEKPVYGVSIISDQKDQTVFPVSGARYKGVFFPTPERAVKACGNMVEYHRFLASSR
ncbi:MAG: acetate--CoA ligase family protein [Thermodesulfobacteriota bacterium]